MLPRQDNFYTLTVYEKGAEIVRMYHTLLGVEGFRCASCPTAAYDLSKCYKLQPCQVNSVILHRLPLRTSVSIFLLACA